MTVAVPLYLQIMGSSWSQIAEPIRCLHATHSVLRARGPLHIEHGLHPVARLLAKMLRLPHPNAAADTRLIVTARPEGEHWARTFDGRRLQTFQYKWRDELIERYGVLEFRFRLRASGGSLLYVQREAAFLWWRTRLRIPARWTPRVEAREDPAGPRQIDVAVRVVLPAVGLLISYGGVVQVEDSGP
jgi:Domain of unknown function (DUF4166)